jgi:hypothetical protein
LTGSPAPAFGGCRDAAKRANCQVVKQSHVFRRERVDIFSSESRLGLGSGGRLLISEFCPNYVNAN